MGALRSARSQLRIRLESVSNVHRSIRKPVAWYNGAILRCCLCKRITLQEEVYRCVRRALFSLS